jgi:hypothetical protein
MKNSKKIELWLDESSVNSVDNDFFGDTFEDLERDLTKIYGFEFKGPQIPCVKPFKFYERSSEGFDDQYESFVDSMRYFGAYYVLKGYDYRKQQDKQSEPDQLTLQELVNMFGANTKVKVQMYGAGCSYVEDLTKDFLKVEEGQLIILAD